MGRSAVTAVLVSLAWGGLAATTAAAASAAAGQIGVGVEAGAVPALSVQWLGTALVGYHVTAHLGDTGAALSADYQRFFVPSSGRRDGWTLGFYAGLGLGGEDRQGTGREEYRMRLPVGTQFDLRDLHLSVFLEAAGLVGPLPLTDLGGAAAGGLRAWF